MQGVNVFRYGLHVSKRELVPPFASLLADLIANARFATPTAFARAAGVNPSLVSRWLSGEVVPSIRTLEKIAPHLRVSKNALIAAAYPDQAGEVDDLPAIRPPHPLAVEVDRLLDEESSVPPDERASLTNLLEHVISPYRRYLRKRRAG